MNVGILIITHGNIGAVLLQSATDVLGVCPLSTTTISAAPGCNPDQVLTCARQAAQEMDCGDGVLVLTDLYGATPSNIACRLHELHDVRVVSGINLPMLIRVLNYPDLDLDSLMHKAVTGGRDGVLICNTEGAADAG
ncbi:MAG TPA: PTS fructose transporter subunit IIA [Gammaproteobacteria bacterium]|nr:PTS fructose transporter subunit IIA [Gammaproteobacteria bacterium]